MLTIAFLGKSVRYGGPVWQVDGITLRTEDTVVHRAYVFWIPDYGLGVGVDGDRFNCGLSVYRGDALRLLYTMRQDLLGRGQPVPWEEWGDANPKEAV